MNDKLNKVKESLFYYINDYDFQTSSVGVYPNYNNTNNKT